jgi:hypothetical protein
MLSCTVVNEEPPRCPYCGKPMQAYRVEEDPQPIYRCVDPACPGPPPEEDESD